MVFRKDNGLPTMMPLISASCWSLDGRVDTPQRPAPRSLRQAAWFQRFGRCCGSCAQQSGQSSLEGIFIVDGRSRPEVRGQAEDPDESALMFLLLLDLHNSVCISTDIYKSIMNGNRTVINEVCILSKHAEDKGGDQITGGTYALLWLVVSWQLKCLCHGSAVSSE